MSYLVRTEKQIAALLAQLEKANAALAIVHADLTGEVAQVVKKTRRPRKAKVAAEPQPTDAPKAKRGRPSKAAATVAASDPGV